MNKIILGKYTNTHGIKGEIKIKSDFKYKDKVFKIGNEIIIDKPYIINSYRIHQGYDMVTLNGIDDINKIVFSKNSLVYIDRDKYLNNNDYLDEDLIGFRIVNSKLDLVITDIFNLTETKKIIVCDKKYIPYELIENIDFNRKIITIREVDGL